MGADPVELVRFGYNAVSRDYRGDGDPAREYGPWLAGLQERIPGRGQVLDIGCGCGVPVARWLRPSGWLLATTGQDAWTGTKDNWLGGSATMWWSHADANSYRTWLLEAGLEVTVQEFVPEGDGGHALFWARRGRDPRLTTERDKPGTLGATADQDT